MQGEALLETLGSTLHGVLLRAQRDAALLGEEFVAVLALRGRLVLPLMPGRGTVVQRF